MSAKKAKDAPLILVCDDEEDTRSLVMSVFKEEPYEVDTCPDGDCALKMIKKKKYSILLLDIMMPGTGFEEVAEKIHKISPETKIILFSVVQYESPEQKRLLSKPNIHLYIQKPVSNEELVNKVKKVLLKGKK